MTGGKNKNDGYTIIEVLIFVTISGLMFLIAANFISSKQSNTEFRQSVNDMNTKIEQVIGDVTNGYYPGTGNFICTSGGGNLVINAGTSVQGTNGPGSGTAGCTFIGKVIQFGLAGGPHSPGTDYNVYTLAGSEYSGGLTSGSYPTSYGQAVPQVVDLITEKDQTEYQLQANAVYYCNVSCTSSKTAISAVGFMISTANLASSGGGGGPQAVDAIPIVGSTWNETEPNMVLTLNGYRGGFDINNPTTNPAINELLFCFEGSSSQFASISIFPNGSSGSTNQGQRLTTNLEVGPAPTGGC